MNAHSLVSKSWRVCAAICRSAGGSPATSKSIEDNGSLSSCGRTCCGNPGRAGRPRSDSISLSILHYSFFIAFAALCTANAALPAGYTELDYIRSAGAQYIDTGVVPKTTTRVVCEFQLTVAPSDRVRCGWASAASAEAFWFGTDNDHANFSASVCGNSVQANTGVPVDTRRHTFDISTSAIKFDGTTIANPGAAFTDAASGNTMYLFASRQGWNPNIGAYGVMKIYSCQIYDGGTPVRDFVPARRDSDDALGLYDTVTDVFYTNDGTGSFVDDGGIAATYTAIEYLQSDGNQYIDTQFILNSTHAATLDFQPTALPTVGGGTDPNGTQSLFGCRTSAASKNISVFIDSNGLGIDFNNGNYGTYRLHPFAVTHRSATRPRRPQGFAMSAISQPAVALRTPTSGAARSPATALPTSSRRTTSRRPEPRSGTRRR